MQLLKKNRAKSIDEYLARVPDANQRAALEKLRAAIHAAAPGVEESFYYHLPAFIVDGKSVVGFGYAARHCALYPLSSRMIAALADELRRFETSKGTIRFQPERPIPVALVKKIVRMRIAENAEKAPARKKAPAPSAPKRTPCTTASNPTVPCAIQLRREDSLLSSAMRWWGALLLVAMAPTIRIGTSKRPKSIAPIDRAAVRAWREDLAFLRGEMPARHGNLFHTMTPAQFDSALGSIDRRLPTSSRAQIIVELMRLTALVGDGHSNVSAWRDTAIRFRELPVSLYRFDDGLFVRAAATEQQALVGARVLEIGGVTADSALSLVRPLLGRDNEMGIRAWAPVYLSMPEVLYAVGLARDPERVRMTVEKDGKRREITLAPFGPFPMRSGEPDKSWMRRDGWVDARGTHEPLWLSDAATLYWYRPLAEGKTLYCQVNAVQQMPGDSLALFMGRAIAAADSMGAERFVLDVRHNGGGNGSFNRAIFLPLIKSRYDAPGRLYVLTSRRTWSAAQMLICEMEKYTQATFAGEPSASKGNHYGDSRRIVLPNNRVTVRVSTLYWQYWDPRDTRPWIEPELPAPLTFADYRDGADPVLREVLARPAP